MKEKYVLLNGAFCAANSGYSNDSGRCGFAVTITGEYVAAEQTIHDFPELFTGEILIPGINIIELAVTDFPQINPF